MVKKVFGIISYFPNNDTEYHRYVRKQRTKRCTELLQTLGKLWPTVDIIILTQNWRDYQPPKIPNNISIRKSPIKRLGILSARRVLRQEFLDSDYDYLIMLDDDVTIQCRNPAQYLQEIDNHPDGIGIVSNSDNALSLVAISKTIFQQITYPKVYKERGEGFEDIAFKQICIEKFSDSIFELPNDVSVSSMVDGISCPSTWSSDSRYNWDYMTRVTSALITMHTHTKSPDVPNTDPIDLILPIVDPSDPDWVAALTETTSTLGPDSSRFRSLGTLKYLMRGIAKYMPFIRDVVLIVASESQIPSWVNRDTVRIVCHKDFIPEEFLPTFNSCTIEAFLYNIPDLAEHIIYFNDDLFPINDMTVSDFFTGDVPHVRFIPVVPDGQSMIFDSQCKSSISMILKMLHMPECSDTEFVVPDHTALPMLRSTLQQVGVACNAEIKKTISVLRESKNVNQYIYHYYQYYTDKYVNDACDYIYVSVTDPIDHFDRLTSDFGFQLMCVNDSSSVSEIAPIKQALSEVFSKKFPDLCKYEIKPK